MKLAFDKERFKLYIRLGGAYLMLWLFVDLAMHSATFPQRVWNNIWLIGLLIINNFIFLEYTLPFFKPRWKRIFTAPLLLLAHGFLYSYDLIHMSLYSNYNNRSNNYIYAINVVNQRSYLYINK